MHGGDRVEQIAVTGIEPHADRLRWCVWDQRRPGRQVGAGDNDAGDGHEGRCRPGPRRMIFPGTARKRGVVRPLLVDEGG